MFPLRDNISTDRFPAVTVALIIVNVLAYFLWQQGGLSLGSPGGVHFNENLGDYGLFPCNITDQCPGGDIPQPNEWLTPLTAMFMHGGLLHLGGNMLFLWIFGNNVEDSMGPVRYLLFYLLAGVAAFALQIAIDTDSAIPNIGASGAVAGVLGGYLLQFPRARVVTVIFIVFFFTIVQLPAIVFLAIWVIQQVLFGYFDLVQPTGEGGGVAYFAHIGGFVFGLLLIKVFATRERRERERPVL